MVSFCTECGAKVESSFKFCPICGSAINLSSSQQSLDKTVSKTEQVIICANCGEENSFESSVCDSCGAKLDSKKILVFIGVSLALVLLVLIASGVLDLSGSKTMPIAVTQQNQGSGI